MKGGEGEEGEELRGRRQEGNVIVATCIQYAHKIEDSVDGTELLTGLKALALVICTKKAKTYGGNMSNAESCTSESREEQQTTFRAVETECIPTRGRAYVLHVPFSPDSSTGDSRTCAHKDLAKGTELAFLLSDVDEKSLYLIRVIQYNRGDII